MAPSDLFFATVLLSAPVGTPEQVPPAERWVVVQSAVHEIAITWEILDPRETRYVLAKPEDFQIDLDFLRKRKADLADAPKLAESTRLPDRRLMDDHIQFNRAYRKHLDTRLLWEADRADVLGEAARETDRLYRLWDAMREAKCDFHYVTYRRLALKKLQEGLGTEVYASGELPPCVPDWRFVAAR
ncbi:MAG: hypothetical protein C0467_25050 [Planctomycetaceae bacterium]|nr:hypothetical protein [Planctomycetaceae bacterium]